MAYDFISSDQPFTTLFVWIHLPHLNVNNCDSNLKFTITYQQKIKIVMQCFQCQCKRFLSDIVEYIARLVNTWYYFLLAFLEGSAFLSKV